MTRRRRWRRTAICGSDFTLYTPQRGDLLISEEPIDFDGWRMFRAAYKERYGVPAPFVICSGIADMHFVGSEQKRVSFFWNEEKERWEMDETNYLGGR